MHVVMCQCKYAWLCVCAVTEAAMYVTETTSPAVQREWIKVGERVECRAEGDMKPSSGKLTSLEQCKKSCEDATGCQSITFYKSGYCSNFVTTCTETNFAGKAVSSWRFSGTASGVASPTRVFAQAERIETEDLAASYLRLTTTWVSLTITIVFSFI